LNSRERRTSFTTACSLEQLYVFACMTYRNPLTVEDSGMSLTIHGYAVVQSAEWCNTNCIQFLKHRILIAHAQFLGQRSR